MPKTKPRLLRRFFQFRLRTLMWLTVVAAVAARYWATPSIPKETLPDGTTIATRRVVPIKEQTISVPGGAVPDGEYEIRDRYGRLLCTGYHELGKPVGRWTMYHVNGRKAQRGMCRNGVPVGEWKTWTETGELSQSCQFEAWSTTIIEWGPESGSKLVQQTVGTELHSRPVKNRLPAAENTWLGRPTADFEKQFSAARADLDSENDEQRLAAVEFLQHAGPRGLRTLAERLSRTDERLQIAILRALTSSASQASECASEVEKLIDHPSTPVRTEALLAHVSICPKARSASMRKLLALAESVTPTCDHELWSGIGRLDADVVATLEEIINDAESPVRRQAFKALVIFLHYNVHRMTNSDHAHRAAVSHIALTRITKHRDPDLAAAATNVIAQLFHQVNVSQPEQVFSFGCYFGFVP